MAAPSSTKNVKGSFSGSPTFEVRSSISGALETDVVGVFQDSGKKAIPSGDGYGQLVERFRKGDAFAARPGSTQHVRFGGHGNTENVLFVGLGAAADLTEERARQAGAHAWSKLSAEKCKSAGIHADGFVPARGLPAALEPSRLLRAFIEGIALAAYQFTKHKSKSGDGYAGPSRVVILTANKEMKSALDREVEQIRAVAKAVRVARDDHVEAVRPKVDSRQDVGDGSL